MAPCSPNLVSEAMTAKSSPAIPTTEPPCHEYGDHRCSLAPSWLWGFSVGRFKWPETSKVNFSETLGLRQPS